MSEKEFLLVLSTCPSAEIAQGLARMLLDGDHAACVNVLPGVRSMYVWDGAVQADDEVLMLIKTTTPRFPALRAALVAQHPYALPEVVAVRIEDGHHPYLEWIARPGRPHRTDES